MKTTVREYDLSDTPSGFLRWSRPAPDEPSWFRSLSATTRKYPTHHMVTLALLFGLPLALALWYVWTSLSIAYRLSSVLEISLGSITTDQHVWCGMVTLDECWQYCARGTIELRIRNRLWVDLTIVGARLQPIRPVMSCSEEDQQQVGLLEISGTEVHAMSEVVYTLPALLFALSVEDYSASEVAICVGSLEIDTLGYNFIHGFKFDAVQVPNFT